MISRFALDPGQLLRSFLLAGLQAFDPRDDGIVFSHSSTPRSPPQTAVAICQRPGAELRRHFDDSSDTLADP